MDMFAKGKKNQLLVAQIYVDDIIFGGVSNPLVKKFIQQMEAEFEMSMVGELKYFLGIQISQMEDNIFISQSKYAQNIVKKFGLESPKSKRTPLATHVKITRDEDGKEVDISNYRSMIRSLLYLTASRSDITHSVGIWNAEDRKSTLGGCFFFGNNLVSWFSRKQDSVSLSIAEVDYITAGSGCTQLLWMKQMLEEKASGRHLHPRAGCESICVPKEGLCVMDK
ncbi:hypothetical protein LIER_36172 [Lithospermum erythrorhizon]|uniref:Reverse transcriptase Ty1/copia-type domain-containing protein n=1 Tax=Lithospermum erythrorhizon TaxID=34254 RepID=A0AAV3P237_LITER